MVFWGMVWLSVIQILLISHAVLLSYGLKPVKGFQVGVDIGMLSTGGASVEYTGHAEEMEEHEEEIEAQMKDISDNFAWTMLPNIQIGVAYGF